MGLMEIYNKKMFFFIFITRKYKTRKLTCSVHKARNYCSRLLGVQSKAPQPSSRR